MSGTVAKKIRKIAAVTIGVTLMAGAAHAATVSNPSDINNTNNTKTATTVVRR